jgi:hypothetical protein
MLNNGPAKSNDFDPERVTNEHVSSTLFLGGCMAISPELFGKAKEDLKSQVAARKVSISSLDEAVKKADEVSKSIDWSDF